jgi:hypothetical protein
MHAFTVQRRAFSRRELAFLVGVPAAWGILLLFHPTGDADGFYEVIEGNVTAWLTVHIGMGIFVPLFAGVVYVLLQGLDSAAAAISRIGLAVFAVLYAAWELLLGAGTGILTLRSMRCLRHSRRQEGLSSSPMRRTVSSPPSRWWAVSGWASP